MPLPGVAFYLSLTLCAQAPTNAAPVPSKTLSAEEISDLRARAQAGNAVAQFKLAKSYESGDRLAADDVAAAEWLRKSAEQGNSDAQNELGVMYLSGRGVPRDQKEALFWYHKAAWQGNADAMFNLGAAYYNGDGVNVEDALSYAWFILAQGAGNPKADTAVERADSELKPWAITEAFKDIAALYDQGQYLPENRAESARWWLKAANRGDIDAQVEIGVRMVLGQGIPVDPAQGRYWCEQVAKQRDPRGENCIGYIYRHGAGVKTDLKEARKWYEQSAQQNNVLGIKILAEMDENGEGAKPDRASACLLYARLALAGDRDALERLARLKPQISQKDWQDVRRQLSLMHANLSKLDDQLEERHSDEDRFPGPIQPH